MKQLPNLAASFERLKVITDLMCIPGQDGVSKAWRDGAKDCAPAAIKEIKEQASLNYIGVEILLGRSLLERIMRLFPEIEIAEHYKRPLIHA